MIQIKPEDGQLARRKLPIGIQTFREIREDHCYYVDKTAYMGRLIAEGKHYFLSRPRRFGKSLFLDTLKELFEGNEPLFEELAIHEQWDWSVRHPVLRLDFSRGNFKEPGRLQEDVMEQLDAVERREGVGSDYTGASVRFSHLLAALHERSGQRVAVLIDEYDKPILDALETPEVARANRDYLHGLYSTIKFGDAHIKFSFLTGVSKFSKVSLFSGLNNLKDITLDPRYSAICGYTEADLDAVFAPELVGLIERKFAAGTTATTGWAKRRCTIRLMSCYCSTAASLGPIGLRRVRRRFCWRPCWRGGLVPLLWMICSVVTNCYRRLTWITLRPRRCCSRPAI